MANMQKHTSSAVGHLGKHYERGKDEKGEPAKYGNQEIRPELSHENYNLAPDRGLSHADMVKQRTSEVHCLQRKDVNVMCSWVVTLPKDFPQDQECDFFQESYTFLEKRYGGEKNVVSAYVHKDENQPHIHFAFVPVVKDRNKGHEKVSAKEAVAKKDLQTFHTDLSKHMERHFGRDVGILNESTRDGNKSIEELKRQSAAERLKESKVQANQILEQGKVKALEVLNIATERAREHAEKVQGLVKPLEEKKNRLEGQIDTLQNDLKTKEGFILNISEVGAIKGKKTLLGDSVTISRADLEKLKETAVDGLKLKSENADLKYNNKRYKEQYDEMHKKIDPLTQERVKQNMVLREKDKEIMDLRGKVQGIGERRDAFLKHNGLEEAYDHWKENVWDKAQAKVKTISRGRERG